MKRVAVTGGAGQIAYSLLFRVAHGDLFDEPVALHILDIPECEKALEGIRMELEDCAFPLLQEIVIGSDPFQVFRDVDVALLVGAKPRGPGMERKDLLEDNGKIFVMHGRALNEAAADGVKVLVVGNPCNTNCLIAMHHAPRHRKEQFHAMTRLDQNRAKSLLAKKAGVSVDQVKKVTVWGNHSSTQVPDAWHATINGKLARDVIQDEKWLSDEFIPIIQKRGAAVIAARGKSSAASAANAVVGAMRELFFKTEKDDWFSSGVIAEGNPYGIAEELIFSFPLQMEENSWKIVEGLPIEGELLKRLKESEKELLEERALVKDLLR